jgi:E3 ubiquitin-protein ligase Hakai
MMEGIFICAAPHCLKSFLKKSDFEAHIHEAHASLLESHLAKEGAAESDAPKDATLKPESSTARGPARQPPISPSSSSQLNDPESRSRAHLQRENTLSKPKSSQSEQVITPEKNEFPFIYPPLPPHQPNFGMGMNMNQPLVPPQPFGNQQFFPNPYQLQMHDGGPDPGSLLGMPPSPWSMGLMGMPVQPQMQMGQGSMEGVSNPVDPSHGLAFLQGMHGDSSGDNKNILANLQMQLQLQMPMSIPPQMPPSSIQQHFNR